MLRAHCSAWAARFAAVLDRPAPAGGGGAPPATATADSENPPEAADDADVPEAVRRLVAEGLIKRPARAVEKAVICYGGDVSRLLDVCRARLAFATAADLACCLEAVCGAPQARVVRVRNWLSPGHDPALTAGYRVCAPSPRAPARIRARPRDREPARVCTPPQSAF